MKKVKNLLDLMEVIDKLLGINLRIELLGVTPLNLQSA